MGVIVSASLKSNEKPTQGQRKLDTVSGMSYRFLDEHEASSPTQNCPWELTLPKAPTSLEGQGDEHYHYPQPARDKENGRSMERCPTRLQAQLARGPMPHESVWLLPLLSRAQVTGGKLSGRG